VSGLARGQTWVTIGAAIAVLLAVVDLGLFERNRALQFEVGGRQQLIQQGAQMETLQRDLVNAIFTVATRNDDAALRAILIDHGFMSPTGSPAAPAPPTPGRPR
jgi:hypothetical protein